MADIHSNWPCGMYNLDASMDHLPYGAIRGCIPNESSSISKEERV